MIDQTIIILWRRRNHQDNLIHIRLSWLIATQAFLLIAFVNAAVNMSNPDVAILPKIISSVGILSTLLVYYSIIGGINTYKDVRKRLHDVIESASEEIRNSYSKTLLDRDWSDIKWGGFLPCLLVPLVFIILWSFLLGMWWD